MSRPAGGVEGTSMAEMPKVGDPAPDVRLQGIGGKEWSLAEQRGRNHVVLLFYVLDWTPG